VGVSVGAMAVLVVVLLGLLGGAVSVIIGVDVGMLIGEIILIGRRIIKMRQSVGMTKLPCQPPAVIQRAKYQPQVHSQSVSHLYSIAPPA